MCETRSSRTGSLAEEVLAHVRAVARLVRLVLAVNALLHDLDQAPVGVGGEQRIPPRSPHDLDHVPAGAAEVGLELLDDLAVAADRAVEALKVAVDDPDQVVEALAAGERGGAHRLGLVHLAVAEERPDLASLGLRDPAGLEVLHEPGLVDRGDRADPERHRRELPELGHQPRMRVRRQTARTGDLLAEAVELLLGEPSLEIRAGVVAGGGVTLEVDEVAPVLRGRRMPEVVVADLVQRRQRLEARDVPAELGRQLVRAHDHRHRVPADDRAQSALDFGPTHPPGRRASRSGGIVFTYGVVMLAIGPLPASCARSTARARICRARSGPSCSTTASTASSHSVVSTASMSAPAPFELGVCRESVMRDWASGERAPILNIPPRS